MEHFEAMTCIALTAVLAVSVSVAAARCLDPKLKEAVIGGNTINGGVILHEKPLRFSKVRVHASSRETAWIGKTDKDGTFKTTQLPPGDYRLKISGWGSTAVRLTPELDRGPFGQVPAWNLLLIDNGCVATIQIMN
jgi:hypothetical protein